jgi:hypothetical protein
MPTKPKMSELVRINSASAKTEIEALIDFMPRILPMSAEAGEARDGK